jgi:amino acid permease
MPHVKLAREVGSFGAIMMGLGSIIGTGVIVSIGRPTSPAAPCSWP